MKHLFTLAMTCLVFLALAAPGQAMTVIGGGNPLIAAGRSAAAAMTAASHTIAKGDPAAGGQGAKGFMETAGAMAKNMWGARQESAIAKNPNSMANQLKSQANAVKALSGGGGNGASAPKPPSAAAPQTSGSGPAKGPVDMRTPPAMPTMPSAQEAPPVQAPTPPSVKDENND